MQYTTIVEKNEEGLNLILEAARQFCEERFLHSVFSNNMTKYEILRLTSHVNTRQSRFSEEIISLVTFANKWLDSSFLPLDFLRFSRHFLQGHLLH